MVFSLTSSVILSFLISRKLASPDDSMDPSNYIALTLLLAFMMGAIQLIAGVLRMGWVVRFLSHAVVSGFSSGAAIILGESIKIC